MSIRPRFEELIERHHDEIFAYLWRLLGKSRQSEVALDAEDLTQEVFLRAYENYSSLRRDSNYRAWLYKIATHCAYTKWRQAKNRREKSFAVELAPANNPCSLPGKNQADRLRTFIDALPAKQKACVTLRYLQDLDYSEIALSLGCTEQSARANVAHAIRRLRSAFEEDSK
jgi:RNA polymerase sigma-70 factor (ECF subfamily)